ncbi:uncharacterized protein METZ01_LOCUS268501 [marine metagenome]|uniref:Uncharacterized protein n=1 Tax=marine metagenome TaxID=408172 RepID=A0A382JXH1_9ZZZZ
MHASIRPEKYEQYAGNFKDIGKLEPAVRYRILLAKFRQDLPLEYSNHMTVYLR